jgi:homoserine kinase
MRARAPATISNLAVGFDLLGMAIDGPFDEVTLTVRNDTHLNISRIDGGVDLPLDPSKNTATIALSSFLASLNMSQGFSVIIKKGIPLGSGLGGSAASAVAALVACNAMLRVPCALEALLPHAAKAEAITAGAAHTDNAAPALLGGLVLCHEAAVVPLPAPPLTCIVAHIDIAVSTKQARALLPQVVGLTAHTQSASDLAACIHALHTRDAALFSEALKDNLVEPARLSLWPHYNLLKKEALNAGASAVCMSGSGPTVLAWVDDAVQSSVVDAMLSAAKAGGWTMHYWISKQPAKGASCDI